MQIQRTDSRSYAIPTFAQEPPLLGKVARLAFDLFSLIAFCLVLCVFFKRKRTYIPAKPPLLPSRVLEVNVLVIPHQPTYAPCTDAQKAIVREIFETTAQGNSAKGAITLAKASSRLEAIGNQIDSIHPFAFLEAIPREPLKAILTSWWPHMMEASRRIKNGIASKIELKKSQNEIDLYIPHFAETIGKDPDQIRELIKASDSTGLIKYLYDV